MPCHAKCFTHITDMVLWNHPDPSCPGCSVRILDTAVLQVSSSQLCPFCLYDVIQSQLLFSWPQGYQAWTASSPSLCFLICMPGISFSAQSDLKKKKIRSRHFSAKKSSVKPSRTKILACQPCVWPLSPLLTLLQLHYLCLQIPHCSLSLREKGLPWPSYSK